MTEDRLEAYTLSQGLQNASKLVDVRLIEASSELFDYGVDHRLATDINAVFEAGPSEDGSSFVSALTYTIDLWSMERYLELYEASDDQDTFQLPQDERVARVVCRFMALYLIEEGKEFTEDEYVAFAKSAGALHLHPYAREYVQDATARLGLRPLTLSPLKIAGGEVIPSQ